MGNLNYKNSMSAPTIMSTTDGFQALWPDASKGSGFRRGSEAVKTEVFTGSGSNSQWSLQVAMSSVEHKKNWMTYHSWVWNTILFTTEAPANNAIVQTWLSATKSDLNGYFNYYCQTVGPLV